MTTLTDKDFGAIGRNEFSLDFLKATLTQQIEVNPKTFTGPATVWQDGDGRLQLKMFAPSENPNELIDVMNELGGGGIQAETLIAAHTYYTLDAFDMYGHVWTAKNVSLDGDISHPMSGRVIRSDIAEIRNVTPRKMPEIAKVKQQFIVRGEVKIPHTHQQPEIPGLTRSMCTVNLGADRTCEIKQKQDALHILVTMNRDDAEEFGVAVLQAIGVAAGAELFAQVQVRLKDDQFEQIVRSKNTRTESSRLLTPIPMRYFGDFAGFEAFVSKFSLLDDVTRKQMLGFWHRILAGVSSSTENEALIMTTAIEGILKACFLEAGLPDAEFLSQLDEAKPLVKGLKLGSRARDRVLTSIGNARNPTPIQALRTLAAQGDLPDDLGKAWNELRNKLVHADELEWDAVKTQAFLDDWFSCLELTYRLIMLKIGYEGQIVRFSRRNWPEEDVSAFKAEAAK